MTIYCKINDAGYVVCVVNSPIDQPGMMIIDDIDSYNIPHSDNFNYHYSRKSWEDVRTIDSIKNKQWASIKLARQSAVEAPIVTDFGTFDADQEAQKSITDAVLMLQTLAALGTPTTIDFTLYDNSTVTLTTEQMVQVGLMLGAQTQAAYSKGRTLRAQIDAATTISEVEAVSW